MEDVEERRRRLAAMREQAASLPDDADVGSLPSISAPRFLSNSLEDSADIATADDNRDRFDYYTDPLAGFSGSKRRRPVLSKSSQAPQSSNATPQTRASIMYPPSHLRPSSVYPPTGASSWRPIEYHPPLTHPAFTHPHPTTQFHPQIPPHHMSQLSNQTERPFVSQTPGRGRDRGFSGRYNGRQFPIGPTGRGDLSGGAYTPSSPALGRGYGCKDPGGRGNLWLGGSPSGESWRDDNRREGRGAYERGQRGVRIVSAKEQPHLFVRKSMLEDPWQGLEATLVERT